MRCSVAVLEHHTGPHSKRIYHKPTGVLDRPHPVHSFLFLSVCYANPIVQVDSANKLLETAYGTSWVNGGPAT